MVACVCLFLCLFTGNGYSQPYSERGGGCDGRLEPLHLNPPPHRSPRYHVFITAFGKTLPVTHCTTVLVRIKFHILRTQFQKFSGVLPPDLQYTGGGDSSMHPYLGQSPPTIIFLTTGLVTAIILVLLFIIKLSE